MKKHLIPIALCVFLALTLVTALVIPSMAGAASSSGGGQAPEESDLALPEEFGKQGSVNAVPSFGMVTDRLSLTVPPGRRSVEPHITLNYNSMGGLGTMGVGWNLDATGYVEFWRGDGIPNVGIQDSYGFSLAGVGGQLINTGSRVYRARMESVYREFRLNPQHGGWEMYNGEGVLHRFGGTADSRIDGKQWMLDLVQDPHGNTITYTYERVGDVLYLSQIQYTGYAPTGDLGSNSVVFEYETRNETRIDYGMTIRQTKGRFLTRISMFAGDQLARRYEFIYEKSALNNMPYLKRVTLVDSDDASRIKLRELQYTSRGLGWGSASVVAWPSGVPALADAEGLDTGVRLVDVNGDAFTDLVTNTGAVYLGSSSGNFNAQQDTTWSASLQAANIEFVYTQGDSKGMEKGVRLLDINSDALPDLLIVQKDRKEVYLNTGIGWSKTETVYSGSAGTTGQQWADSTSGLNSIEGRATFSRGVEKFALAGYHGEPMGVNLVDVNADGRVDIVWSFERPSTVWNETCGFIDSCYPVTNVRAVFLNNGTGWTLNQTLTTSLADVGFFVSDGNLQGYDMLDVNGDGLADIIRNMDQSFEVRLGTGSGWVPDTGYSTSLSSNNLVGINDDKPQGLMPLDFNGDGLVDYFQANQTNTKAFINNGNGWVSFSDMAGKLATLGFTFSTSDGKGTGTFPIDLNGDGLLDIIQYKSGNSTPHVFWGNGPHPGLLAQSTSALGEVTTVTWAISTNFNNKREDGVQGLPMPIPVVSEIMRQDGSGNQFGYTFSYVGGLYTGRQLRGFRQSEQVLPSHLKVISRYYQDEGLVGSVKLEQSLDTAGMVRLERKLEYQKVNAGGGVFQIFMSEVDDLAIDPEGQRHVRTDYQVDDHLVYTSVLQDPNVDIAGDEVTTKYYWARNDGRGIWALLSKAQSLDASGNVLQESITYFDGLPENQAEKGLPTRVLDMVGPGEYVTRLIEYDQFGNIIKAIDRENNASTFAYDSTSTFRVHAVDAEGRVYKSVYDPRFGSLIEDTDAAGRVARTEYDAFGRVIKITYPGDENSPFGSQTITYSPVGDPGSQYYTIAKTEVSGEAGTLDTTYYYDGMGRVYRAESEADGGRKVVTLARYNYAGNANETTRPFFEGDPQVWTTVVRDELNRPVLVMEQNGDQASTYYAGWRVDITDARGFKTSYYRNSSQQITEIHQGAGQVTYYHYDPLGNLTGITDALGEETYIDYDAMGRRLRLVDPNTGTYEYSYDNEGRLVGLQGPGGSFTRYTFDRTGLLLSKEFSNGSSQKFTYNPGGELIQVNDAAGTLTLKYDGRGRPITHLRTVSGETYETQYAYDALDRVTGITYPDGYKIHYKYGSGGNLLEVTDGKGAALATGMTYNAAGQLLKIQYGNGVQSNLTYDDLLRMTSIQTSTGKMETIQNLEYGYDPNSNVLSINDKAFQYSQSFEYDALNRLVKATGQYGVENYEYDAIGNLLRKGDMVFGFDPQHPQRVVCAVNSSLLKGNANGIGNNPHAGLCDSIASLSSQSSGANSSRKNNQITTPNPNLAQSFKMVYDEAGNAVEKGGMRYEYDSENHLVKIRDAKGKLVAENVYDSVGQRVIQITPNGKTVYVDGIYEAGKTHVSRHVFAGPLLLATVVQPRSLASSSDGVPPNVFNALAGMVGLMGVLLYMPFRSDEGRKRLVAMIEAFQAHPHRMIVLILLLNAVIGSAAAPEFNAQSSLALRASEKTFYYHSNHLGNVNAVTDEKGKVVERREYKPYGETFQWTGPNSGPREFLTTFQGQLFDDAAGLYYMGARHYDPQLGRFLAADTQVPDPMDPQALNRYAFVEGNPIRYNDPTGHGACEVTLAIIAVLALVVLTALIVATSGIVLLGLSGLSAGLLAGGIVLGAAAVGAIGFGVYAATQGYSGEDFWDTVALGAVAGAVVGSAICTGIALAHMHLAAGWGSGASIIFMKITGGAVFSASTGTGWFIVGSLIAGNSTSSILGAALFAAMLKGAATGAAMGAFSLTLGSIGWGTGLLAKMVNPGGCKLVYANMIYVPIASSYTKQPHALIGDLISGDLIPITSSIASNVWSNTSSMRAFISSTLNERLNFTALNTLPFAP